MEVFKIIKGLLSFKPDKVLIDSLVFRLHYRFTSVLLLGCTILVTSYQFFGDPIDCIARSDVRPELLDRYCWVQTTFSLPSKWTAQVGSEVLYPGVGHSKQKDVVYHAYYQWVCFVLFFQAILFYVPHYVWKALEGGRLKKLKEKIPGPFSAAKEFDDAIYPVVRYIQNSRGLNLRYGLGYLFCETLNLLNVIGQIYLMNRFLGGQFFSYGFQVISFTEWAPDTRYDPMVKRFPRVTKCTFRQFGASGNVQETDHMCLLSVNIINEKVYLLLWFWFFGLALVTMASLLHRIALLINFQNIRYRSLSSPRFISNKKLRSLCHNIPVGHYLLLTLLMKNVDRLSYDQFIKEVAEMYMDHIPHTPSDKGSNGWPRPCSINLAGHHQQEQQHQLPHDQHDHRNRSLRSTDM